VGQVTASGEIAVITALVEFLPTNVGQDTKPKPLTTS